MSQDPTTSEYDTPQSEDGTIVEVKRGGENSVRAIIEFRTRREFHALVKADPSAVAFASRSRLARLGIDVRPTARLEIQPERVLLHAEIQATVSEYGVGAVLPDIIVTGLKAGRLVFCPPEGLLTAEEVVTAIEQRRIQLPAGFSLSSGGVLTIRPHHVTYGLARSLSADELLSILVREDGRAQLSMLQVPREAPTLVVPAGDGVITSCSMFLHEHYVVIDSATLNSANHLQAVVLDPVTTRGSRVFLEFFNPAAHPVLNPYATARIYRAIRRPIRVWPVFAGGEPGKPVPSTYDTLYAAFEQLDAGTPEASAYFRRACAVSESIEKDPQLHTLEPLLPASSSPGGPIWNYTARGQESQAVQEAHRFGSAALADLPANAGKTLMLGYFPNFVEHVHICSAALEGKVARVIFRRASFEHGMFLSARDHGRLADYQALGVGVYWLDEQQGELLRHVFLRGKRGFFVGAGQEARLKSSLLFAFYGSARPLPEAEEAKLRGLIGSLKGVFGENMGILTGGGPGAMQQATEAARAEGLLAGASYIETADQGTIRDVDFFQSFQDRSRHYRQRWFDVCSFQVFCIGGVGTLEEIGQTLTDMKLGIIERGPLVFFGSVGERHFWQNQVDQLRVMAREGRGPDWLHSHALLSDDHRQVVKFYRDVLALA